jgi:hypothetical protein
MSLLLGDASRKAAQTIQSQGLSMSEMPETVIPVLPRDLTAVGDEDLMVLYSLLTAWADFVGTQMSAAQVDERAAERRLDHAENLLMIASSEKGDRVTFARAQVAADPQIVKLKDAVEEAHAYRKLIEAEFTNIERNAALVSRELTRRTSSRSKTSTSRWSA